MNYGDRGDNMAIRPVFVTSIKDDLCVRKNIEFEYCSGFSIKQQQKSIMNLHNAFLEKEKNKKILEISSKSKDELGIKLSAFNLIIKTKSGKEFSVESAFQASKIFEKGGPYKDLLDVSPRDAKKDLRLKNSGNVIGFYINGNYFPIEPTTYFYNWLYINTLHMYHELTEQIIKFDAFTDIVFNPNKSINCQAEAAAIYVSLYKRGLLEIALKSKEDFLEIVYPHHNTSKISDTSIQLNIFDYE